MYHLQVLVVYPNIYLPGTSYYYTVLAANHFPKHIADGLSQKVFRVKEGSTENAGA